MIYNTFQDKQLSLLGFGAMRLPLSPDGTIDEAHVDRMVRYAMEHGVNYFDTAWPYHGGTSERVLARILKQYDRDSYYLATKYPGHQLSSTYNPAEIFEAQLKKCNVEYFDFYLLHNVYENSIETYLDPKWGIIDYFKEQKRLGRIKHLGFSTHAQYDCLKRFLDLCGEDMEFCQMQLNYLDWTLQNAKASYELLTERNIPVWVMEPVRGGRLANLAPEHDAQLKSLRPEESTASWSFRFLQNLSNVKMILSGMSNMEQMIDNIKTFSEGTPLSTTETQLVLDIADTMKTIVPCTACRYCCEGCPMGLDIPTLLNLYNEISLIPSMNGRMRVETLPEDKQPASCIGCGMCTQICPQNIDVPHIMTDFVEKLQKIPSWVQICKEREEAAKRNL